MEKETCTWLDLWAHDILSDDVFIQGDKYEDYMKFLHDEPLTDDEPSDIV